MIALIWGGLAFHADDERQSATEDAIQHTGNLARAFEGHITQTIRGIDQTLLFLRASYQQNPDWFQVAEWTATSAFGMKHVSLTIVGPDGKIKNTNIPGSHEGVNLSDRDHFRAHVTTKGDPLFISKPVLGRVSGQWSIQITRGIKNVDGSFAGVVVATLSPQSLTSFYESINIGKHGIIALSTLQGDILAARGDGDERGAKKASAAFQAHIKNAPFGHYLGDDFNDGVTRLVSFKIIDGFPMAIKVGLAMDHVLENLLSHLPWYQVGAAGLTAIVLFLIGLSIRHRLRLEAARQAHRQLERFAAAKADVLQTTLENIDQGILMADDDGGIAVMNQRAITTIDVPDDFFMQKRTLAELMSYLADRGEFGEDGEALDPDIRDLIQAGALEAVRAYERTRPNGAVIEVRSIALPNGGLVRTLTDTTARKASETQIAHMALHDALTGLSNRIMLLQRMEQSFARLRRHGEEFALMYLDLDKFKPVNDTLGHAIGDLLLREVGARLHSCTRDTDLVARLGGDEFAVLQSASNDPKDSENLAERLLGLIGTPYIINGRNIRIGVSIGVARAPRDGLSADQIMNHSDVALYRAKLEGRNCYRVYDREMDSGSVRREALSHELRQAQIDKEFELHFQPWVNLRTNQVLGFEALVRWRHPTRGLISPGEFIPIAEQYGLIVPISEWILKQACLTAATWPGHIKLAVNLSPAQLMTNSLIGTIKEALRHSGFDAKRLELEITETVILQDNPKITSTLHEIRRLGIAIALDDFGTGYSSLTYLRMFPFDRIKIDQTFVRELDLRADCAAIVSAIAGLGRTLGIATTAEGIETQRQLDLLRVAGCGEGQGLLFGGAAPADRIPEILSCDAIRAGAAA